MNEEEKFDHLIKLKYKNDFSNLDFFYQDKKPFLVKYHHEIDTSIRSLVGKSSTSEVRKIYYISMRDLDRSTSHEGEYIRTDGESKYQYIYDGSQYYHEVLFESNDTHPRFTGTQIPPSSIVKVISLDNSHYSIWLIFLKGDILNVR